MHAQGEQALHQELLHGLGSFDRSATAVLVLVRSPPLCLAEALVDSLQERQTGPLPAQVPHPGTDVLPRAAMHLPQHHNLALSREVERPWVPDLLHKGHGAETAARARMWAGPVSTFRR